MTGAPDELMFVPGLRARLAFNAAASWYLLWGALGTSPDGAVPDEAGVWAQVLWYSSQTRPSISRFSGLLGKIIRGLCLQCRSMGVAREEISF